MEPGWRTSGRRLSRRALLIAAVSLTAGPLTYLVLPVPSAAEPGLAQPAPVVEINAVQAPALVGGLIRSDDLITDPIGVMVGTPDPAADGELIGWPVSDHTPSSGFGYRRDPFTHQQRWHDGIDLGQPCGDPAWASLDGTVVYTGWAGGYGNRVILRHAERGGQSFETAYSHLSEIEVRVGQVVQRGFVVGRVGSTGRSTACHMHFEVILGGYYVDPMRFLTGDQSKAGLSRKVGSYMPSGMPSPGGDETESESPAPSTPASSRTPSPSPTPTPAPTDETPTPTPTGESPTPTPTDETPAPTGTGESPSWTPSPGLSSVGPSSTLTPSATGGEVESEPSRSEPVGSSAAPEGSPS